MLLVLLQKAFNGSFFFSTYAEFARVDLVLIHLTELIVLKKNGACNKNASKNFCAICLLFTCCEQAKKKIESCRVFFFCVFLSCCWWVAFFQCYCNMQIRWKNAQRLNSPVKYTMFRSIHYALFFFLSFLNFA